jgi:hypothetical protein
VNRTIHNVLIRDEHNPENAEMEVQPGAKAVVKWGSYKRSVEGRKAVVKCTSFDSEHGKHVATFFSIFSIGDQAITSLALADLAMQTRAGSDYAPVHISIQDSDASIRYPGLPCLTVVFSDDMGVEESVDRNWELHFHHKQLMSIRFRSDAEVDFGQGNNGNLNLLFSIQEMEMSSTACKDKWSFGQKFGSVTVLDELPNSSFEVLSWRNNKCPTVKIQATGPYAFEKFQICIGSPCAFVSADLLFRIEKVASDFQAIWVEETENVVKPVAEYMTIMSLVDFSIKPFILDLSFEGPRKQQRPLLPDSSLEAMPSNLNFTNTPIAFSGFERGSRASTWKGTQRDLMDSIQQAYTSDAKSHWATIISEVVQDSAKQSTTGRATLVVGDGLRLVGDGVDGGVKFLGLGVETGIRTLTGGKDGIGDEVASKVGAGIGEVGNAFKFGVGSVATGFEALGAGVGMFGNAVVGGSARTESSTMASERSLRTSSMMSSERVQSESSIMPSQGAFGRSLTEQPRNLVSSGLGQVGRSWSAVSGIARRDSQKEKEKNKGSGFLGGLF